MSVGLLFKGLRLESYGEAVFPIRQNFTLGVCFEVRPVPLPFPVYTLTPFLAVAVFSLDDTFVGFLFPRVVSLITKKEREL